MRRKRLILAPILSAVIFCGFLAGNTLPEALKIDLEHLKETWNILDQYAEKIWQGWRDYRDVPFLFNYPNGMRMLVGHPYPTDEFELVPGLEVDGKKVFIDRSKEIPLKLKTPLSGGGGVTSFGKEKLVTTVSLQMRMHESRQSKPGKSREAAAADLGLASEGQILVNIHELFHCFQRKIYQYRFGNLSYNADLNYAVYAEIEGLALEKSYLEEEEKKAREYLKDFVVARELKRRSMTEIEQGQESEEDFMEGTAVFSEVRTLELMNSGYRPHLARGRDPYFYGFLYRDLLFARRLKSLRRETEDISWVNGKCYYYGCFQALLLSRFFPGWQENFARNQETLDRKIADLLNLSLEEKEKIARRLKEKYNYKEIEKKYAEIINERDAAYEMTRNRRGRVYVINFKPIREFITAYPRGKFFTMGLTKIYPEGIAQIKKHDILFKGGKSPMVKDRLYYIKWVDTEAGPTENSYKLKYGKKEGEDIFYDAEFTTKGFTLKAPKIRVKILPARIKVYILAKIKPK